MRPDEKPPKVFPGKSIASVQKRKYKTLKIQMANNERQLFDNLIFLVLILNYAGGLDPTSMLYSDPRRSSRDASGITVNPSKNI